MAEPTKPSDKNNRNMARGIGFVMQLGVTIVSCILVSVLLGRWLDVRLGTEPWLLLLFLVLGLLAAFKAMIDMAKKL